MTIRKSMLRITRKVIFLGFSQVFIPSNATAKSELLLGVTNFVVFLEAHHIVLTLHALIFKGLEVGQEFWPLLLLLIQKAF